MVIREGVGKVVVAEQDGSSSGEHSVLVPGVTEAVLVTSPPGQSLRTVACTVKVTVPPGASTTGTEMIAPVPLSVAFPLTVEPGLATAVQVMPCRAGESKGSSTVPSAWVVGLVLLTVMV